MKKVLLALLVVMLLIFPIFASSSYASGKESFGAKFKSFWINLLSYPARVTEESASVVADTAKRSVGVIADEIERFSEVAAGDVAKTKELITEPITGTAETVIKTVEDVISIPSEAAKEKTTETAATDTI